MVFIILGILCMAGGAIPVGIIFIAVGIFRINKNRKPKHAYIAPAGIPSRKQRRKIACKIAGVTFECREDAAHQRQSVLKKMHEGDLISIKEFRYDNKPAYLIIDQKTGLDVGAVPAEYAAQIPKYKDPTFEGYLTYLDTFNDEEKGTIYYGEVLIFIL